MEIRDICMYVCMYSFFYGTFTRTSMNNLDSMQRTALFMRVEYSQTNAVDSSIAHTHGGRQGNKLKRRQERERESNIISWNTKNKKQVGGKIA